MFVRRVFVPHGDSRKVVSRSVTFENVTSRVLANSLRAAMRTSPGPAIVPPAIVTLVQFSMSTALDPVPAMSTRSTTAPPDSDTQKMPRPPPRATTSPTRTFVGYAPATDPLRLAMRNAAYPVPVPAPCASTLPTVAFTVSLRSSPEYPVSRAVTVPMLIPSTPYVSTPWLDVPET
jgi:hypothetical protein